jgi:hypothetical protein
MHSSDAGNFAGGYELAQSLGISFDDGLDGVDMTVACEETHLPNALADVPACWARQVFAADVTVATFGSVFSSTLLTTFTKRVMQSAPALRQATVAAPTFWRASGVSFVTHVSNDAKLPLNAAVPTFARRTLHWVAALAATWVDVPASAAEGARSAAMTTTRSTFITGSIPVSRQDGRRPAVKIL